MLQTGGMRFSRAAVASSELASRFCVEKIDDLYTQWYEMSSKVVASELRCFERIVRFTLGGLVKV